MPNRITHVTTSSAVRFELNIITKKSRKLTGFVFTGYALTDSALTGHMLMAVNRF